MKNLLDPRHSDTGRSDSGRTATTRPTESISTGKFSRPRALRASRLLGRDLRSWGLRQPVHDLLIDPTTFRVRSFVLGRPFGSGSEAVCAEAIRTSRRHRLRLEHHPDGVGPPEHPHPPGPGDDDSLRRLSLLLGSRVIAPDGRAGAIEDVLLEDGGWRVLYFVVRITGTWPRRRVLILPNWVRDVDGKEGRVRVALPRARIEECPRHPSPHGLDPAYVLRLQSILAPFGRKARRGPRARRAAATA